VARKLKDIPDSDTDANLRGFAIRFILAEDGQKNTATLSRTQLQVFALRTGGSLLA
jgi:hypothetical protein